MENDQVQEYEQPNAYVQSRYNTGGAQSKWRVDTKSIRLYLEHKLKGYVEKEVVYYLYEIRDKENDKALTQFLSANDEDAEGKLRKFCDMKDLPLTSLEFYRTGEKETKVQGYYTDPLLPQDICDRILSSVDTLFSQVGYLTKYTEEDINKRMIKNLQGIRKYLCIMSSKREDVDANNLDLVLNLIDNMIHPVLKASEGGWTGQILGQAVQERMVTHESGNNKKWGIFG